MFGHKIKNGGIIIAQLVTNWINTTKKDIHMMKKLMLLVIALMFSASAFAGPWSYHFNAGFDSNPFDGNNNTSPINYPDLGMYPSPAEYGGEPYDLEGVQVREKDGLVYVAVANSFGFDDNYNSYYRRSYNMGDLFINTGNSLFAIDIQDMDAGTMGSTMIYDVTGGGAHGLDNTYGGYGGTPTGAAVDAMTYFEIDDGLQGIGSVDAYLGFDANFEDLSLADLGGTPATYVWEFCFDRSLLGDFKNLQLSATLACGNDVLLSEYDSAIPEPTTLLLFGMGLAGAGIVSRRRKK